MQLPGKFLILRFFFESNRVNLLSEQQQAGCPPGAKRLGGLLEFDFANLLEQVLVMVYFVGPGHLSLQPESHDTRQADQVVPSGEREAPESIGTLECKVPLKTLLVLALVVCSIVGLEAICNTKINQGDHRASKVF
jgi:hypothetical protein